MSGIRSGLLAWWLGGWAAITRTHSLPSMLCSRWMTSTGSSYGSMRGDFGMDSCLRIRQPCWAGRVMSMPMPPGRQGRGFSCRPGITGLWATGSPLPREWSVLTEAQRGAGSLAAFKRGFLVGIWGVCLSGGPVWGMWVCALTKQRGRRRAWWCFGLI